MLTLFANCTVLVKIEQDICKNERLCVQMLEMVWHMVASLSRLGSWYLLDQSIVGSYNRGWNLINIINQINLMKTGKQELLSYLADTVKEGKSIPSIAQLGRDLGLSNAAVREQLEVARQLEFVDIKTKTGIQVSTFSVKPAICLASRYGLEINPDLIWDLLSIRQHLELSYWKEAVASLSKENVESLGLLVERAFDKMDRRPIIVPIEEHREFHLSIYRPLGNSFLLSILESYWDLFTESEIRFYSEKTSMEIVWEYHKKIYQAIASKEYDVGYQALMTHFKLVATNNKASLKNRFE